MKVRKPTKRQREVLRIITSFQKKHGYLPTYEEIGKAMKITTASVWSHINLLEKKGLITRNARKQRAIVVLT